MTPSEWDAATDVNAMLDAVRGRVSDRKFVFFALGCCRAAEGEVPAAEMMAEHFERMAARPLVGERSSLFTLVRDLFFGKPQSAIERFLGGFDQSPWTLCRRVALVTRACRRPPSEAHPPLGGGLSDGDRMTVTPRPSDSPEQAGILREVVGNPFADPFDPRWQTETAVALAHAIDAGQAWDRMPILADALEDAGCEDARVLGHCRAADHPHRRGCWVVDAILDRP